MDFTAQEQKKEVKKENYMEVHMDARPENESLARLTVAGFLAQMNPTLEVVSDIKTAVSEAVTNAIIHGYQWKEGMQTTGKVHIFCKRRDSLFEVEIRDDGCGIADVALAMEPLYTSRPDLERSGMGFSFMEAFMDELEVESVLEQGTRIKMKRNIEKDDGLGEE